MFATSGETNILSSLMYPPSIDISILFSILLPNKAILRLFFLQVSTMCFNLYMLDANVATIILPFFFSNISCNSSSTLDSLAEKPGDKAFVDSLIKSFTPLFPVSDILCISLIGPIGVKSNLKSPVSTILPLGVEIIIPCESGIEWVVAKNSTVKCLNLTFVSSLYTFKLS